MSEVGMHQEAINYYIEALEKKPTHIDAQIGLKNSSTLVLNNYTSKFFTAYSTKDNKTAVYTYLEMQKMVERVNLYHVRLSIPSSYQQDFENAKDEYLKARFIQANHLIGKDLFNDAFCIFEEIETIEPNFKGKDFETLKELAQLEPHYRKGNSEFGNNQFRLAYYQYKKVFDQNPKYKDIQFKLDDALNNAQFNIGVLKFKNYTDDYDVSGFLSSAISNEIINNNSPFIKLIDRSNTELLKDEQLMNLKGMSNGKSGELMGAHVFLSAKVLSCSKTSVYPKPRNVNAYESYQVKKYDPVNKKNYYETEYRKVRYKEYYGYNEVYISFEFQLISTETGQILLSEIVNQQAKSEVNYANYNGNYYNLVPGNWASENYDSPNDKIFTNRSAKNELQAKFNSNKTATSISVLKSEAGQNIAKIVAEKIINFNPEDKNNG